MVLVHVAKPLSFSLCFFRISYDIYDYNVCKNICIYTVPITLIVHPHKSNIDTWREKTKADKSVTKVKWKYREWNNGNLKRNYNTKYFSFNSLCFSFHFTLHLRRKANTKRNISLTPQSEPKAQYFTYAAKWTQKRNISLLASFWN